MLILLQVPLGIQLYNENKLSEMCLIVDAHHKYVPTVAESQEITLHEHSNHRFHKLLLNRDQLTVARVLCQLLKIGMFV